MIVLSLRNPAAINDKERSHIYQHINNSTSVGAKKWIIGWGTVKQIAVHECSGILLFSKKRPVGGIKNICMRQN